MSAEAKEKIDKWMRASFKDDLKKMWEWIKGKKVTLLIVLGWSVAFAIITFKSYWLLYMEKPVLAQQSIIFTNIVPEWVPRLDTIDYLVMMTTSLLAGALLTEFEDIFYGWVSSLFLSFILSATLAFLFVWFSLGAGVILSGLGLDALIRVLELVMLNVFRMWFPIVPILSLITAFGGAFLSSIIR